MYAYVSSLTGVRVKAHTTAETGPRKRDPERRRREILDAAAEIVVQHGAAALTHRAVAAQSGLALGTMTRHFPSIDELREATLRMLGDEVDAGLDMVERELSSCDDLAERCAQLMHESLLDARQVHATMALVSAATSDVKLRSLALRWTDRLADLLAQHVGRERAVALEVYLDGALMHAALHDAPLTQEAIARVVRAILATPDTESK